MRTLIRNIRGKYHRITTSSDWAIFLLNGLISFTIRIVGTASQFVIAIVLVRVLGADGYGIYSFVFAATTLLTIPAQLGLPQLMIRETARTKAAESWDLLRGFWHWSGSIVTLLSILIFSIGSLVIIFWCKDSCSSGSQIWIYGLLLGVLVAITNVVSSMLVGLQHSLLGQMASLVVRPVLFFLLVLILTNVALTNFDATTAMAMHLIAVVCSLIFGIVFLQIKKPTIIKQSKTKTYNTRAWLKSMAPLFLTEGLLQMNLQLGVVVLGFLVSSAELGYFRLATQLAMLALLVRSATIPIISPYIPHFTQTGEHLKLKSLIKKQSRLSFIAATFVAILFVFIGKWLLNFAGNQDFIEAYSSLIYLVIGYAISTYFGPGEFFLMMRGSEKYTAYILTITVLLNILLIVILVPFMGIEGAALATAIAFIVRAVTNAIVVKKLHSINICVV